MLTLRRCLLIALIFSCSAVQAQIISDFATNADGWTTPNDADATISYSATGGNPNGFVFGSPYSLVLGATTFYVPYNFVAPGKFLGNRSAYYNGTLRYDIQQSSTNTSDAGAEVSIFNNAGIGLYYYPATPFQPVAAPGWTTFSIRLNNTLGYWKTSDSQTGTAATEAQLQGILGDLATLNIRGLYRQANVIGRLDNVTLYPPILVNTQPLPSTVCLGLTATFSTAASNNAAITYQWQRESSPSVWTNITNGGGYSNATTATLSVNTTGNFGAGNYRARISGTRVDDAFTNSVGLIINVPPSPPATTNGSLCGPGNVVLSASGGTAGQYRWYTSATGGPAIPGVTNNSYNTPSLPATTTYYVALNNGCESTRTAVTATINTPPAAPSVVPGSSCGAASVVLTASGGSAGQYRWYTVATGGPAIAGQTNSTYTTPNIATTTTYYVAINNGTCESTRTAVTATINTVPAAPSVTTPASSCVPVSFTLTASGGTNGQYRWYNVATGGTAIPGQVNGTYATPTVNATTTYYVSINNGSCESTRTPVIATIGGTGCPANHPPVIDTTPASTQIGGTIEIDLTDLISDEDNNLDLSTLTIITPPASGATAVISNNTLIITYTGTSFSGTESIIISVCDIFAACAQQTFTIEVDGAIEIFNAVSPGKNGKNDVFFIENIDKLESTRRNHVSIYNRWGEKVWEADNYNNTSVAFNGKSKNDAELPSGTYYYKIEFNSGLKTETGYLSLKR